MMTMVKDPLDQIADDSSAHTRVPVRTFSYFILTVLGFSFWFFMALPFASHRESYMWLALVRSQAFADILVFNATTFRPLAQAARHARSRDSWTIALPS